MAARARYSFANNTIHQNVAEENYGISVRTAFDGRTARATTNKYDDESLERVVQASESLAKFNIPIPICCHAGRGRGCPRHTGLSQPLFCADCRAYA